ncbi:MAG: TRAP transporter substrate-binding protein DctP [Lentisphaerota bacterium]
MMIKKIILLLLSSVLLFSINVFAQTIKLATIAPDGSQWHKALLQMAQDWKDMSDGKIVIQIYAGGVAGDDPDLIRKMRIGQIQAAAIATSSLAYFYPDVTTLTFPNNIKTDDELKYVVEKLSPLFNEEVLKKGFKILCWTNAGWVHFFSKDKVVTPDDMRKQKLFYWGSEPVYFELLKKTGFNPIPLSVTDLLPGLQTGLVTAFAAPPQAALGFQWYSQAPNMCALRWQPLPGVIIMTEKAWKQIPDELKPKLMKSAQKAGMQIWDDDVRLENESISVMEKHGLKVNNLSPEDIAQWQKGIDQFGIPLFIGHRFSAEVFAKVNAALKEYRDLNKDKK